MKLRAAGAARVVGCRLIAALARRVVEMTAPQTVLAIACVTSPVHRESEATTGDEVAQSTDWRPRCRDRFQ